MTRPITEPSEELIQRLNCEYNYEQRLEGSMVGQRCGDSQWDIYSVKELIIFLGFEGHRIEHDDIVNWICQTVGDPELANELTTVGRNARSNHHRSKLFLELLRYRYNQCTPSTSSI